jgi:hypothetical protein
MNMHCQSSSGHRVSLVILAVVVGVIGTNAASGQTQGVQYAAKFVCGVPAAAQGVPPVAPGAYFTAVNVHNPGTAPIEFRKKFVIALPGEKAGRISQFFPAVLKADEAFEIDCEDIIRHLDTGGFLKGLVKGFVVIESPRELDVVAVYTAAANPSGPGVTMALERVPKRP